jgi:hypothetical protein
MRSECDHMTPLCIIDTVKVKDKTEAIVIKKLLSSLSGVLNTLNLHNIQLYLPAPIIFPQIITRLRAVYLKPILTNTQTVYKQMSRS